MKNTMKLLVVLATLAFAGCNEKTFNGTISLKQPIQLLNKDKKPVALPAGEISAQFKAAKKDRIDLILVQGGQKQTVPVKVNFSIKDIQSGTHINVTPQVSGQLYTLTGDYQVNTTSTGSQTNTESCSYEYNHHEVCDYVTVPGHCYTESEPRVCDHVEECDPNTKERICKVREYNCRGGGSYQRCTQDREERRCHTESDTYHGSQEVTSYGTTTTKYYTLDILDNGQNVGRIRFGDVISNRTVTNETSCN